jgi:hypothetical protein
VARGAGYRDAGDAANRLGVRHARASPRIPAIRIAGLTRRCAVPTGEHLAGATPSVGGNRWVAEARYRHTIVRDAGRTWIEVAPGVRAFGDDGEPRSGSRLRQRPQFVLEGLWSVAAGVHGTWLGAGLVGTVGGRVEIDGVPRGEAARALRAMLSAGAPLRPGTDVLVGYSRTVVHTEEAPRADRVEFVLRHRF